MPEGATKLNKKSNTPELPWWVEFLFVQIGLPDNWLRGFLKARKRSRRFISDNKTLVFHSLLAFVALIYLEPLVKQARINNLCVENSKIYLTSITEKDPFIKVKSSLALAKRFCNGGNINNSI